MTEQPTGGDAPDALLRALDDGVLTLTLNRPDKLNAIDTTLFDRLLAAVEEGARDPAVRVVLLRGAGRAFSAGGDLGGTANPLGPEERTDLLRRRMGVTLALHRMPKPTVAMLRGATAGGALAIALGCDLRIASDTVKIIPAFARAGFSGDFGISYLLTQLVGTAKAREILFLGDHIAPDEALRLGLVNRVVADSALEAETAQIVARLADGPGFAYRLMKRNLSLAQTATFEESLDAEAINMVRSIFSDDSAEAVRAFLEKRPPNFRR